MTRSGDPASTETSPAQATARGRLRFVWTSDAAGTIRFLTDDPRLNALRSALDAQLWPENDAVATAMSQFPLALRCSGTAKQQPRRKLARTEIST